MEKNRQDNNAPLDASLEKENDTNKNSSNIEDTVKTVDALKNASVEVPASLRPEQMEKLLLEREASGEMDVRRRKTKKVNWKAYAGMAAGLIVLVGAGVVLGISGGAGSLKSADTANGESQSAKMEAAADEDAEAVAEDCFVDETGGDNYAKAYAVISEYVENYNADIVYDDFAVGESQAVMEDAAEVPATDGALKKSNGSNDTLTNGVQNYGASKGASRAESKAAEKDFSTTNVRTQGVDEGDIVKTDGNYIYAYDESTEKIIIYEVKGTTTKKIGKINLNPYGMTTGDMGFFLYKNQDQDQLIVTGQLWYEENQKTDFKDYIEDSADVESYMGMTGWTRVLVFDIQDRPNPKLAHGFFQDGYQRQTRISDGVLYTISGASVPCKDCKEDKPQTYIPKVGGEVIAEKDVIVQPGYQDIQYTVMSAIDLDTLTYVDQKAVLGGMSQFYMSEHNMYLVDCNYDDTAGEQKTQLMKLSYSKGKMNKIASTGIKGWINDDYAMDEHNGYLRLVSTYEEKGEQFNGLFIYDEMLTQTGCIKNLAKDEQIYSARFINDTAYFVTYRNTDPLFAVDVRDPEEPKMLSYLKIPGFSSYLHPYKDGLLLGIGKETTEDGDFKGVKLSMFDISNPEDIKEVDKTVLTDYYDCAPLNNPNALLIDPERNIIGMQCDGQKSEAENYESFSHYNVYSYKEGSGFSEKLSCDLRVEDDNYGYSVARGAYIDENLYVVNVGKFINVYDMKKFKLQKENKE